MRGYEQKFCRRGQHNSADGDRGFPQSQQNCSSSATAPEQSSEEKHRSQRPVVTAPENSSLGVRGRPRRSADLGPHIDEKEGSQENGHTSTGCPVCIGLGWILR